MELAIRLVANCAYIAELNMGGRSLTQDDPVGHIDEFRKMAGPEG